MKAFCFVLLFLVGALGLPSCVLLSSGTPMLGHEHCRYLPTLEECQGEAARLISGTAFELASSASAGWPCPSVMPALWNNASNSHARMWRAIQGATSPAVRRRASSRDTRSTGARSISLRDVKHRPWCMNWPTYVVGMKEMGKVYLATMGDLHANN